MHMADALVSTTVGLAMWGVSGTAMAYAARRLQADPDERRMASMGVLGAFLFAVQMVNFAIPGTGSSGHLGGGLLLALLLGPHAAFVVMASVLTVQALFFADGGLLALGCNLFNLGFLPAYVGYPLCRRWIGANPLSARTSIACVLAAVLSLQWGAMAVVLQTTMSGISALPMDRFLMFMLPIHLAIGVVEGLATAAVLTFVRRVHPDVFRTAATASAGGPPKALLLLGLALAAGLIGGVMARFASKDPDGLEWAVSRVAGAAAPLPSGTAVHAALSRLQQAWALMPDYAFSTRTTAVEDRKGPSSPPPDVAESADPDSATSWAGLVGSALTLGLVVSGGMLLRGLAGRPKRQGP